MELSMARKPKWGRTGKTISIYVTAEQAELLEKLARAQETSVSDLARRALRQLFFVPANGAGSNQLRDSA